MNQAIEFNKGTSFDKVQLIKKIPSARDLVKRNTIYEGKTAQDLVTFGRVPAERMTITLCIQAQREWMDEHESDISVDDYPLYAKHWDSLERQVRIILLQDEEISKVID